VGEGKTYRIVIEIPYCIPTFKQGTFLMPGKMRIHAKVVRRETREFLVVEIHQLSKTPPSLSEIGLQLRWLLEHLDGYCTQT